MSYYNDYEEFDDDEPFFENDECTDTLNKLKAEIEWSVKQEIKEELAFLRKENEELQGIKERFDAIKAEYAEKQRKMNETIKNAEKKFATAKLNELMKFFTIKAWAIDSMTVYLPKCNKCNEYREIDIRLPSGKEVKDECPTCGKGKKRYYIRPYDLCEINDYSNFEAFYLERDGDNSFGPTKRKLKTADGIDYTDTFDIEYNILLRTKEEAQKVCDTLNSKEGVTSDWIYNSSGIVFDKFKELTNNG